MIWDLLRKILKQLQTEPSPPKTEPPPPKREEKRPQREFDEHPFDPALVETLRTYCLTKPGAFRDVRNYVVMGYDRFAAFHFYGSSCVLDLKCDGARIKDFLVEGRTIYSSPWQPAWDDEWEVRERDTACFPLDENFSEEELRQLIDRSYELVIERLSEESKQLLALSLKPYSEQDIVTELLKMHTLEHKKDEVEELFQPTIALITRTIDDEREIPLGGSKIGGLPDFPPGVSWPIYPKQYEGQPASLIDLPLPFLAQINLAEIPPDVHLKPLPETGILYFFSIMAWQIEYDTFHPDLFVSWPFDFDEAPILYFRDTSELQRAAEPGRIRILKAAPIEFKKINTLPGLFDYWRDPAWKDLDWPEEDIENLEILAGDLYTIRRKALNYTHQHQLLGYANPIQNTVTEEEMRLLFQFDSDMTHSDFMVGDGGRMYYTINKDALEKHDFTQSCMWSDEH